MASTDIRGVNKDLNQMIQIVAKLEGSYIEMNREIDKGLTAISGQAKTSIDATQKLSAAREQDRKKIDESVKQSRALLRAQTDLENSYKSNAVEILKIKKIKQDMIKQQKLELTAGKGAIKTYDQLSARYRLAAKNAKDLAARYGENNKKAREAINVAKQYNDQLKNIDASLGNQQRNVGNYSKALNNFKTQLVGIGAAYLGVRAIIGFFRNIGSIVTKFSSAQSNLAAVLGKTKDEMGDLTKVAKEYGSTTAFTATQVTELQTELAKLGFTEAEIVASTEAVLGLAAATKADLADAAKVTGVALRAFQMDATEAERVTSVLAVATTKSALAFNDYETALSTVAPVAKAFGFSIEDTVALLGKLKDAGFDASSAATATRNIILNLADGNGKLAKSLGGSVKSFDQLIPALNKLRKDGVSLNETLQLTDKRSVAAFNTFLEGADSALELRDSLIDVKDEMQEMIDTQMDNLTGDITKLSSAWEGFILGLQDGTGALSNATRGIVQFATRAVQSLNTLDLWFKSEKRFTTDDFERLLLAAEKVETESGIKIARIIENFESLTDSLKGQDFIDVIDLMKKEFVDAFVEQGESITSAEGLWEAYLRRRMVQVNLEAQAQKDALLKQEENLKQSLLQQEKEKEKAAEREAKEAKKRKEKEYKEKLDQFKQQQELDFLIFKNTGATEEQIKEFKLEQTADLYLKQIELAEKYAGIIGDTEIKIYRQKVIEARKELMGLYGLQRLEPISLESGAQETISAPTAEGGGNVPVERMSILDQMGLTEEDKQAALDGMRSFYDSATEILTTFADMRVEQANRIVEAADREVDSAERALDREIALAEQGYANNIEQAKRNLELQKQSQAQALADQKKAVQQKQRIETLEQSISLITAVANVIKTFSSIPIVGWALGIAASAAMIGAFVAQKAKARKASKEFSGGGYEEIDGGTHASGNDTTIGFNNGMELKAEKGESVGVFTEKARRKYGKVLPDLVKDANKGRLESRYMNAFSLGAMPIVVENNAGFDSKELKDIKNILEQIRDKEDHWIDTKGKMHTKKGNTIRIMS